MSVFGSGSGRVLRSCRRQRTSVWQSPVLSPGCHIISWSRWFLLQDPSRRRLRSLHRCLLYQLLFLQEECASVDGEAATAVRSLVHGHLEWFHKPCQLLGVRSIATFKRVAEPLLHRRGRDLYPSRRPCADWILYEAREFGDHDELRAGEGGTRETRWH